VELNCIERNEDNELEMTVTEERYEIPLKVVFLRFYAIQSKKEIDKQTNSTI